jgi:hypothetical protein
MNGNNTATLTTITSQLPTAGKCLTFWYHLFGRDSANFSLYVNDVYTPLEGHPILLWTKHYPQSNTWTQAQVNIPVQPTNYYLMFRAELMAKSRDDIGLDDISFTDGKCPPTPLCDFEVRTKI